MRYYLHIPLPENERNMVWALEREFGVPVRSDPHITIVPPREIIEGRSESELTDAIGYASGNFSPCMIIEKEVGYFNNIEGRKETICVGLKRTPKLLALHEGLVAAVDGILKPSDSNFANMPNPHITLITKLPPDRMDECWKVLEGSRFFSCFRGETVTLLSKYAGGHHWEGVKHFRL